MDISAVAKKTGIPASTLRFYEEKGLIRSIGRQGLKRVFAPDVLDKLALIALGRAAGFTLEEIGLMFTADGQPAIDRERLSAKADQLDKVIVRLQAMSRSLRHAAVCPATSHMACPSFQKLLKAASAGVFDERRTGREA